MERKPEPELMDEAAQARAYAEADFEVPHSRVIELFRATFPSEEIEGDVLDLGCGPGDIAIRFARAYRRCRVIGLDGAAAMLQEGRLRLFAGAADVRERVLLVHGRLPDVSLHGQTFDTIVSNSLLHHLHDPQVLWQAVRKFGRPGAKLFVVDLRRPASRKVAHELTEKYCVGEPDVLRHDFHNSLLAAFTPEEIRAQLEAVGLGHLAVAVISDRHVLIHGRLPEATAEEIPMSHALPVRPARFDAALFDLDGTLLDTLEDLGSAVNRVMSARGFPTHPMSSFNYFVGEGARTLIERSLPPGHRDAATVDALLDDYRKDYGRSWNVTTKPYAGIPELLEELQRRGLALGVLSNKPHGMTVKCIEGYLAKFPFKAVLGQRDDVAKKPDPAGAFEAARLMGVAPDRVLYLGDTGVDMQTARAAGMFALGVTWGFRPEIELRENGASAIIHHPADVLKYL
jgi:2-phosphoglycolate phosphatase